MKNTTIKQGENIALRPFVHLHTHTEYSLLDGLARIGDLVDKAIADGMPGIAITDHANMYGVGEFLRYVEGKNRELGISFKPIVGCEVYVARRGMDNKGQKEDFGGYHLILLAKNLQGYQNLVKIVSNSNLRGFYGRPRTDHAELERYHEGLICCSACIGGEVAQHILNGRLAEAEMAAKWHKSIFGEDYYLELQRHTPTVERASYRTYKLELWANRELIKLSKKLGIKLSCSNDIHFVNEEEAETQDCLLCINCDRRVDDPTRLIFTKQEWMKTTAEMNEIFYDIPEALDSTIEICNKVERYSIEHAPLIPKALLPEGVDEVEHLARLTFEGASTRYGSPLPNEVKERLKQELKIINRKGFASYFLMLHEIVTTARDELGVMVGPGRGTMACSAVLYCLGVTQIDPIKWGLEFELFLSVGDTALPMVSFDVDERGREKLLQWLVQRYGEECVADVVSLTHITRNAAISGVAKAYNTTVEEMDNDTMRIVEGLAGKVCAAEVHSCSVALCSDDISKRVPLAAVESSQHDNLVVVTQYSGEDLRSVGVVTLDILSLKALSVIKHFAEQGVDIESIPLDDERTFDMLCNGNTAGVFQFDSDTMRTTLKEAQPTTFEALVDIYSRYCGIRAQAIGYTLLAYQTAYLRAHYPQVFVAVM